MIKLKLEVIDFIKGKTVMVDESPVVNDDDYCEVITSPNILKYNIEGEEKIARGTHKSYEELLKIAVQNTIWNEWYYEMGGEDRTFKEVGLSNPIVYDPEEGNPFEIKNISNYINCKGIIPPKEYNSIKNQLMEIAKSEIEITISSTNI